MTKPIVHWGHNAKACRACCDTTLTEPCECPCHVPTQPAPPSTGDADELPVNFNAEYTPVEVLAAGPTDPRHPLHRSFMATSPAPPVATRWCLEHDKPRTECRGMLHMGISRVKDAVAHKLMQLLVECPHPSVHVQVMRAVDSDDYYDRSILWCCFCGAVKVGKNPWATSILAHEAKKP